MEKEETKWYDMFDTEPGKRGKTAVTVIDLLKMHSLEDSYIIAGLGGQHRTVKRIDFLENPFPDVKMYMELDELIFTTFFNMKDDKPNRIAMVRYMIEHGSAGIAVMPDVNLHGEIDPEILELGNRYDFPIIYIPNTVRYSDIIEGYGLLTRRAVQSVPVDYMYFEAMKEISGFHLTKNVDSFCRNISEKLRLPLIVTVSDNAVYTAHCDTKTVALILAKVDEIRTRYQGGIDVPISIYVTRETIAIFSFRGETAVITYFDHFQLQEAKIRVFQQIAPILLQELLTVPDHEKLPKKAVGRVRLDPEKENYMVVVRREGIGRFVPYFEKHHFVYRENIQSQSVVLIVSKDDANAKSIFAVLRELLDRVQPQLLIFSRRLVSAEDFEDQVSLLRYVLPSLLFLKGIFSTDELPILYIMLFSPYDFKETLYSVMKLGFAQHVKPAFFDTLRLYLLLNNINDVSDLLGIHPNSVKYQIHKCFAEFRYGLSELPALKLLTKLEMMKVENFHGFQD